MFVGNQRTDVAVSISLVDKRGGFIQILKYAIRSEFVSENFWSRVPRKFYTRKYRSAICSGIVLTRQPRSQFVCGRKSRERSPPPCVENVAIEQNELWILSGLDVQKRISSEHRGGLFALNTGQMCKIRFEYDIFL